MNVYRFFIDVIGPVIGALALIFGAVFLGTIRALKENNSILQSQNDLLHAEKEDLKLRVVALETEVKNLQDIRTSIATNREIVALMASSEKHHAAAMLHWQKEENVLLDILKHLVRENTPSEG